MELKHIAAFIAAFEEGSINRAAQRLGSPQPSVSVLIRDLEAELQVPLFERQARGVEPSEAARTIYPHFQRVLSAVDAARLSITGRLTEFVGPLHAGLGQAITRGLLQDVLGDYIARYPRVDLRIAEGLTGRLTEWTLSGELDFAVVALPPKDRRVIGRRLSVEPVVMISGPASGRKHLEPVDLTCESDLKVVLPWSRFSIREVLESFIQSGEIPAARTMELDSISAILDFVVTGDWVTFLPLTAVARDLGAGRLVVQPISNPVLTAEFYLIHPARRALTAAAIAFAERLEIAFQDSSRRWQDSLRGRTGRSEDCRRQRDDLTLDAQPDVGGSS